MTHENSMWYIAVVLLLAFVIPAVIFFHYQQNIFKLIRPEFRRMPPGQVWLQLIPVFGLIWQFFVIRKLSDSIQNQLNAPVDDEIFGQQMTVNECPTYSIGMTYAVLICFGLLHIVFVQAIVNVAGICCWIIYWAQLAKYKKMLKEQVLLMPA